MGLKVIPRAVSIALDGTNKDIVVVQCSTNHYFLSASIHGPDGIIYKFQPDLIEARLKEAFWGILPQMGAAGDERFLEYLLSQPVLIPDPIFICDENEAYHQGHQLESGYASSSQSSYQNSQLLLSYGTAMVWRSEPITHVATMTYNEARSLFTMMQ